MAQEKSSTIQHPKSKHYLIWNKNPKKGEYYYEWVNDYSKATEFRLAIAKSIADYYFYRDPQFRPSDMIIKETIF